MSAINRRNFAAMAALAWLPPAAGFTASADDLPLIELPGHVEAPDFFLPDLTGMSHRLSDYRGRVMLISFWAVWCAPCRRELPSLAALSAQLGDTKIGIFALNLDDSPDRISAFLAEHPSPGIPILLGDRATGNAWHIHGLPVTYVVDCGGTLRLGAMGERDWGEPVIEGQLRALLGPSCAG
jgi:thiol-disulfide isomerase/thioredoxin